MSKPVVWKSSLHCFLGVSRRIVGFHHEQRTINAAYYCQLLIENKRAYRRKRPDQPIWNIRLLHVNARPHTAALTLEKLERKRLRLNTFHTTHLWSNEKSSRRPPI